MKGRIIPHILKFKRPAGTSRGTLTEKQSYYIHLEDEQGRSGLGECGVFPGLSPEWGADYELLLRESIEAWERGDLDLELFKESPSILMGWETAMRSLVHEGLFNIYPSDFSLGKPISINGLIWMGNRSFMEDQIKAKVSNGFTCIKLKIGSLDWETEIELLKSVRERYTSEEIELRVDANGAFSSEDSMRKLEVLSELDIHSIEQPIEAGQWDSLAKLCKHSPLPIALDEELIGIHDVERKRELLDYINPQYLILKPSLMGGFNGSDEWIMLAEKAGIGWWATSALESNIGLNAISQWVSIKSPNLPQGLGTGALYTNNIPSPLEVEAGKLSYSQEGKWQTEAIL